MSETSQFIQRNATQPWFLVFASNDPHEPWNRGPKYDPDKLTVPSYLHDSPATREALGSYYGEISKLDEQVGALMSLLDETTQATNTLVLFVSEQGSSMRAVRDAHYKLIRNLTPDETYSIHGLHKSELAVSWEDDAAHDAKLAARTAWLFNRPGEELYDLVVDPYETANLAADPKLASVKRGLQAQLDAWMTQQGDQAKQTEMLAGTRQGKSEVEKATRQ